MKKKQIVVLIIIPILIGIYFYSMQKIRVASIANVPVNTKTALLYLTKNVDSTMKIKIKELPNSILDNHYFITTDDTIIRGNVVGIEENVNKNRIYFSYEFPKTYNPFLQFTNYQSALTLKKNLSLLIEKMNEVKDWNLAAYGLPIAQEKVQMDRFMSYKFSSKNFPSLTMMVNAYKNLSQFITQHQAKIIGKPMLHIDKIDGKHNIMMAYPIDKDLDNTSVYSFKRMVKGNILKGIVHGGYTIIEKGIAGMNQYMNDNGMTAPAINYETFDFNNRFTADSSQWLTELYFPTY